MALTHLAVILSPPSCKAFGNGIVGVRRRPLGFSGVTIGAEAAGSVCKVGSRREVGAWAILKAVMAVPAVESGERIGSIIEIPVTCYQILGVPEKAGKDEIVKAAMQLKSLVIEDGYTADVIISRQNLLMDVKDKLFFLSKNMLATCKREFHQNLPSGCLSLGYLVLCAFYRRLEKRNWCWKLAELLYNC